jgi:hypothetical protein
MVDPKREEHIMLSMNAIAATEHAAELRRAADRRASSLSSSPSSPALARMIALRLADAAEADVVHRLAALDDAPDLEGQVLLAFVDGAPIAALSLRDGRVVANPFVPTQEAVELLRLRESHLLGRSGRRRSRSILRPRYV